MTLYLSKICVSDSPSVQALSTLLSPSKPGERTSAHHKLLWAAFSDGSDRIRDFLWREVGPGVFVTLSGRAPLPMDLFAPHDSKIFAPALSTGNKLRFVLRANATRTRYAKEGRGSTRVDVVMDALHGLPHADRAAARMPLAQQEGAAWLARQGEAAGFRVLETVVEDYSTQVLDGHRGKRKGQPQFGILEMSGVLEITAPEAFLAQLPRGFGRAKGFGCGLMLVRRA